LPSERAKRATATVRSVSRLVWLVVFLFATAAFALDDRSATSPDGRITFRVFVASQEPGGLSRLAYRVLVKGKPVIDTSYLGMEIENQEPLLGENEGLVTSKSDSTADYHSLTAEFMQNGSIGRRINVEARVYNDGVAFRYVLPQQTPLEELLIDDEVTEFRFPQNVETPDRIPLPLVVQEPGIGWIAVTEVRSGVYPIASLAHLTASALVTRLAHPANNPTIAFEGTTPMTGPWRVVIIGADKAGSLQSSILQSLNR
jgi:alpha-glucosidase